MNPAELYIPFVSGTKKIMMQMGNIEVSIDGSFYNENEDIVSYGVSSIISFAGKMKGRLLLDMEPNVALTLAQNVTGVLYTDTKDNMVLASVSELNNIIAGDGVTDLNNKHALSLRLAPPIVFTGKDAIICIPKISSASLNCISRHGKLRINVAFERSV